MFATGNSIQYIGRFYHCDFDKRKFTEVNEFTWYVTQWVIIVNEIKTMPGA